MYPRPLYVAVLSLGIAGLQFAASFNQGWLFAVTFALALVLGAVVFYQGERRVVAGPIFSNLILAICLGTAASTLVVGGLLTLILGIPWDYALWQGGLLVWEVALGIDFTLVTGFFVVGVVDAMN